MEEVIDLSNQDHPHEPRLEMGLGEWLSWMVILASVVLIVALPILLRDRLEAAAVRDAYERPGVQILLSGRYIIGAEQAIKGIKSGAAPLSTTKFDADMSKSIEEDAKNGPDKLRAAIVRGELQGGAAGVKAVDDVAAAYPKLSGDAAILREIYGGGAIPDAAVWEGFHERHGWFADLAASFGKPDNDPLRQTTLNGGVRTVVGLLGAGAAALLGATMGLVLLIVAAVFFYQRKMPARFARTLGAVGDKRAYVQSFAIYLGGMLALGAIMKYVLFLGGMWGALALPLAFGAALMWPRLRGQTWREWRMTVGLHSGAGVIRELFSGALGYVAGLPIFGMGIIATIILAKLTKANPVHPITQEISTDPGTIVVLLLLASVWAPITEELMFRGALFAHLRQRFGWWISALSVSLIFAIIHPQGWAAVPALGSLAMVLAAIREWRGSLLGCMMAHAINNTILIIVLVVMIS